MMSSNGQSAISLDEKGRDYIADLVIGELDMLDVSAEKVTEVALQNVDGLFVASIKIHSKVHRVMVASSRVGHLLPVNN